MTHEEQQALFDTILRRANLPGSFNVKRHPPDVPVRRRCRGRGLPDRRPPEPLGHRPRRRVLHPAGPGGRRRRLHPGQPRPYGELRDSASWASPGRRPLRPRSGHPHGPHPGGHARLGHRQSGYPLRRRHLHLPHEARLPGGLTSRHPFPALAAPPLGAFSFPVAIPPK